MEKYLDFAYLYDKLTYDVDYNEITDYIEQIFNKFCQNKPNLIADLACGTGTMCEKLSDRGYDMIGIDFSENMLDVAMKKSQGKQILYLNQDITEFELYGTVDAFICILDSINHLTDISSVEKTFKLANNYLNPEGIFIFDLNSKYKFENILSNNTFTYDDDNIFYVWENEYDENDKICDFYLTFFVKEDGVYNRFDQFHSERCYETDEIKKISEKYGFDVLGVFGNMSFDAPSEKCDRIFYVLRKKN